MTDETETAMSEERREALIEAIQNGDQDALVGSWLAEQDADITGLRALIEAYEHKFVAKNAEIERLRGGRFVSYETARDMAEDVRADERRRTAVEIRLGMDHFNPKTVGSYLDGYLDACRDVARICDEVGGSDDQQ